MVGTAAGEYTGAETSGLGIRDCPEPEDEAMMGAVRKQPGDGQGFALCDAIALVQRLSLARGLEEIMAVVRRGVRHLTGADGVTFVLRDGGLCHYADEDAISPLWKGQRFPLETCISGWESGSRSGFIPVRTFGRCWSTRSSWKPRSSISPSTLATPCLLLQWHFLNPGNLSLDMAPASDGLVPSPPV